MEKYKYTYQDSEGYCYPGTNILKNKLGIRDDSILNVAEREITSLKLLRVYNMPMLKVYDLNTLCKIHKIIFEDIYEWAGQIRKGDFLSKGGSIFCRGQYIVENANKIFRNGFGNKDGFPIFVQHDTMASINDIDFFADLGKIAKVICIARPGYGGSSSYVLQNILEYG